MADDVSQTTIPMRLRETWPMIESGPTTTAQRQLANDAADEIERLRSIVSRAHGAMQALHPSAASDMADADYARLWNATMEMLENAI